MSLTVECAKALVTEGRGITNQWARPVVECV